MKKRIRKERYITERKSRKGTGSWQINIRYKDRDGSDQCFRRSVPWADYPTEVMALDAACIIRDEALQQIRAGTMTAKIMTVEDCLHRLWKIKNTSKKTQERHLNIFNSAMADVRNKDIRKIRIEDLQESVSRYASAHSQLQVSRCISLWRMLFQAANNAGMRVYDLTPEIITPKSRVVSKKRLHPYTTHENFWAFLEALDNRKCVSRRQRHLRAVTHYVLLTMYYLGVSPSEAFALSRTALDPDKGEVSITRAVGSDTQGYRRIIPVKEIGYRERIIPMPEDFVPIAREILQEFSTDLIFADLDGGPVEIDAFSDLIGRTAKANGITFNAYSLRHLFSHDLGTSAATRDLMGHSSETMTMYYANSTKEERKNLIENRKYS